MEKGNYPSFSCTLPQEGKSRSADGKKDVIVGKSPPEGTKEYNSLFRGKHGEEIRRGVLTEPKRDGRPRWHVVGELSLPFDGGGGQEGAEKVAKRGAKIGVVKATLTSLKPKGPKEVQEEASDIGRRRGIPTKGDRRRAATMEERRFHPIDLERGGSGLS